MKQKPIIGLMPLFDDDKNSLWMLPGYMDGIREVGGLPFMFPLTSDKDELTQLVNMCDGILFTGGHDVSPEIYNEEPLSDLIGTCRTRDDMELTVLNLAVKQNKSILGICRGIQFINAAFGGSLYQDLPTQFISKTNTEHHQTPPYDIPVHSVKIIHNSPLAKLLHNKTELMVNSYHHQAIKTLAPNLETMAISCDNLIEAIYEPSKKFLWAVQWHPEFSYKVSEENKLILQAFVDSTKN